MHKLLFFLFLLSSCYSVQKQEIQTGEIFPSVIANSLSGKIYSVPDSFNGEWTLLLIAYEQKTQFEVDRWVYGLLDANLGLKFYELPTIAGLVPSILEETINNGMKVGIPKPDWDLVLTVYKDAPKIIKKLGNKRPNNVYAVLLNPSGKIVWIHNEGYSPRLIFSIKEIISSKGDLK